MLAGRVPFTGDSPTVIMMKQVGDEPPSVLEARPDLPGSIDNLIKKALAKQPVVRFQTAGELSGALAQAAARAGGAPSSAGWAARCGTRANHPHWVGKGGPCEEEANKCPDCRNPHS